MSFKNFFCFLFFCTVVYDKLDSYGIEREETPTLLAHFNNHIGECKECLKLIHEPISTRLKSFFKEKKASTLWMVIENKNNPKSDFDENNPIDIIQIHFRIGGNRKFIPDFRGFHWETLLYQKALNKLHQMRANLRVYDDTTIFIESKDEIAIDYKIYKNESASESFENKETNFIIIPMIDGSLFLIVAIPKTDPLYQVIIESDDFKKYDYTFIRENAIYIFSTRQRLLNDMSGEQIFKVILEKYDNYEEFLDILDKHVKDKRMTFCFESVPDFEESTSQIPEEISDEPSNIDENPQIEVDSNITTTKSPKKPLAEVLVTKYAVSGVVLFRIIEYDDDLRCEYFPSAIEGLDKEILCVKEVQLKGIKAVKEYIIKKLKEILDGKCDFENSIEGFILDDGINLIRLRYSTFVCLRETKTIDSYHLYELLSDPAFAKLLENMRYPKALLEQANRIKIGETHFSEFFEILKKHSLENCHSSARFTKEVERKFNIKNKKLMIKLSDALNTTYKAFFKIFYDFFYRNSKFIDVSKFNYDDFLRHFFDRKYINLKKEALKD